MKIFFFAISVIFLTQRQSDAGVVRKQPAFATPVYSNSYLPAAMQVIFHAVEQLKHLEAEETISTSPTTTIALPTTSPHGPGQHQPSPEEVSSQSMDSTASIAYMASTSASVLSTDVTISQATSVSEPMTSITVSEASSVLETVADATDSSSTSSASDATTASSVSDVATASIIFDSSPTSSASDAATVSTISDSSADSTTIAKVCKFCKELLQGSTVSESVISSTISEDSTASTVAINPTGSTPNFINLDMINVSQPLPSLFKNDGLISDEKPEVMEQVTMPNDSTAETPEQNYVTPEVNQEVQEMGQEVTESNQEIPEKNDSVQPQFISLFSRRRVAARNAFFKSQHGHGSSEENDEGESGSFEDWYENSGEFKGDHSGEYKGDISSEFNSDESDSSEEEEDDEIRFTMIGEKVTQVPRPSLSNYLRKTAKAPLRSSVQDLATLYDALSKDARKQGLAKYAGYSSEVLQTLESSIEGGVGPQLQILLEKAQERNEITRDDTKRKLSITLKKLADPASLLSRDLRRLIPLRYIP